MKNIIYILLFFLISCNGKESFNIQLEKDQSIEYNFEKNLRIIQHFPSSHKQKDSSVYSEKGIFKISKPSDSILEGTLLNINPFWKYSYSNDSLFLPKNDYLLGEVNLNNNLQYSEEDIFIKLIIPISNNKMEVGDSIRFPIKANFNINNKLIKTEGLYHVKFEAYLDSTNKENAVLKGQYIPNIPINKELNFNVEMSSNYVYSLKQNYYTYSEINYSISSDNKKENYNYLISLDTNESKINNEDLKSLKYESINQTNSPIEIATSVLDFLQKKDTLSYIKSIIPLKKQKSLFYENIKYNPDDSDTNEIFQNLKNKFSERFDNFFIRVSYLKQIMIEDKKFEINKAKVDTIYFNLLKIKQYGYFGKTIIANWADLTVEMTYNKEKFYLEIPQIVMVENEWFLYYPEFYLRDESEKKFIEQRIIDLKAESEDFWK